ncbi:MAG: hypothetical protein KGJ36_02715 [Acidobacteriota bacterium]|nr:hypothetical protein [Acidobacteriota bacterium]
MKRSWVPVTVVVIVAVGLSLWFGLRSTTPTTTTTATTTTISPSTTSAIWPTAASGIRFTTPAAAARGFAVEYLGMSKPLVGAFRQGDSRSGEVPVHTSATGPETTVLVRQLGPGTDWSVIGAATQDIDITSPTTGATVASPMDLRGRSLAFEGVVNVTLRDDVSSTPLVATTVMGGGTSMAPFSSKVTFATPASTYGALVLYTRSAKDGSVVAASVIRVRFG